MRTKKEQPLYGVFHLHSLANFKGSTITGDRFFMLATEQGDFGFKFQPEEGQDITIGESQYGFFSFVAAAELFSYHKVYTLRKEEHTGYLYLIGKLPPSNKVFGSQQKLALLRTYFLEQEEGLYQESLKAALKELKLEKASNIEETVAALEQEDKEWLELYLLEVFSAQLINNLLLHQGIAYSNSRKKN